MMTIETKDGEIEVRFRKNRRAKRLRLTVYRDRTVALTLPARSSKAAGIEFVRGMAGWISQKMKEFANAEGNHLSGLPDSHYRRHRQAAMRLVDEKARLLRESCGFQYNKITVRNQKTRWGSCSAKGNLSFNYKLLFVPPRLVEYVVCHELCHLKEMNHSKNFWQLLGRMIPDYKERRMELKKISI
jgi:predicted metal-dependent hydrolase